ncbi:hypothetical protein [Micromonospora zhanjiangensis]
MAGGRMGWRLAGRPAPTLPERVGGLAGLRVLRMPGSGRVLVLAGTVDRIRQAQADPRSLRPVRGVAVVVAVWRAPWRGWSGGVGPVGHLTGQRVSLPRRGRGTASVHLRLARAAPLRDVLEAALGALAPNRPLPAPASADLTAVGGLPAYLPAGPGVTVPAGELPTSTDIRAHDVLLDPAAADAGPVGSTGGGSSPGEPAQTPYAVALPAGRHAVTVGGRPAVLVDARRINPYGRREDSYLPDAPRARLEFGGAGRDRRWGFGGRGGSTFRPSPVRVWKPRTWRRCGRWAWWSAARSRTVTRWGRRRCWRRWR